MRIARLITGVGAVVFGCATAPSPPSQAANAAKKTPLILEKDEGERRVVRGWPGHPEPGETFILKVDPQNGGSPQLVFFTADLAPGKEIVPHRHPNADEILFVHAGSARVHLGASEREVHAGATVFIPAGTRIAVSNIGSDGISVAVAFSAPGFEDFMRATSVREGEKNVPLSQAEEDEVEKKHLHAVMYEEP
jgi:quercetin dioxygenase-like cupin family protein